jgi:hypothetical protein
MVKTAILEINTAIATIHYPGVSIEMLVTSEELLETPAPFYDSR